MLERIFRLFVLLVVVAVLAYMGLWFRAADTAKNAAIETLQRHQDFAFGTVKYGKVTLSGFPFRPGVEIADIQLATPVPPVTVSLSKVVVTTTIWADGNYTLRPMGAVHVTHAAQEADIILNSPLITVGPSSKHYEDKGFSMVTADGKKVLSSSGVSATLTHKDGDHVQIALAMDAGDGFQQFTGQAVEWQRLIVAVDASSITTPDDKNVEYQIDGATLMLDEMKLAVKGKVKGQALLFNQPDVWVDLTFTLAGYPSLFTQMVKAGWVDEANKAALTKLVPDIADSADDTHATLTLRHTPEEDAFRLGKLTLDEAMDRFSAYGGNRAAPQ